MSLSGNLRYTRALITTNLKASFANRAAFWLQVVFMALNNLVWLAIWGVIFARFDNIRGWRFDHYLLQTGLLFAGIGMALALFGGVRFLSSQIQDGSLDGHLALPRPVLLRVWCSRSLSHGWGDMLTGLSFVAASGHVTISQIPLLATIFVCAIAVYLSYCTIIGSLSFWIDLSSEFGKTLQDIIIIFSSYPERIFGGWSKLLIFTAVPAGVMIFIPVRALDEFTPELGLLAVGASLAMFGVALAVFHLGLRRYTSGNRFTGNM